MVYKGDFASNQIKQEPFFKEWFLCWQVGKQIRQLMAESPTKSPAHYAARGNQECMPQREVKLGCLVALDMVAGVHMDGGAISIS